MMHVSRRQYPTHMLQFVWGSGVALVRFVCVPWIQISISGAAELPFIYYHGRFCVHRQPQIAFLE